MTESAKWYAPFTPNQVAVLTAHQDGFTRMHEYTCSGLTWSHGPLNIGPEGWWCSSCEYRQNWAWAEKDPFGLVDRFDDAVGDQMAKLTWYVLKNDLVGGWCVMPCPMPPSSGYPSVADMVWDKEIAIRIASLHNAQRLQEEQVPVIEPTPPYLGEVY